MELVKAIKVAEKVSDLIVKRQSTWSVVIEYPCYLAIKTQKVAYNFGTTNETWGGDVLIDGAQDGGTCDYVPTLVDSESEDVVQIADAIIAAICEFEG
jgi:hypothetical protein